MAEETSTAHETGNNPVTLGMAGIAGTGFTLMMLAAAVGVVQGADADMNTISLFFYGGAALFITGSVAWGAIVRPWENFDDINIPVDQTSHPHAEEHLLEAGEEKTADLLPAETPADD